MRSRYRLRPIASRTSCFAVDTPDGGASAVTREDTWDDVSPRLVLDYKITPNVMMFGSVAKGYKAGGYNSVEVGSEFDNEDVWNVEAGVKSLFPDAGVMLNASAFYYIYSDKQAIALVNDVDGSDIPQYVIDTSDEEAWGIDLEAQWRPVDHLTLYANAGLHRRHVQGQGDAGHGSHRPVGRADG